jgi:DNA repair protein RecN (Recombination protein N)
MLKRLKIEQFVIIDHLDIDFQSGLTILTGETGAGKSIILDAFLLILGADPDFEAIRQGAEQSNVEAEFAPPPTSAVWPVLEQFKLGNRSDGVIKARREITRAGTDKMWVNGIETSLAPLKELGDLLGEIHGQNANASLSDSKHQMKVLDLAGEFSPGVFDNVREALETLESYVEMQKEETAFVNAHSRDVGDWEQIVKKLEAALVHEIDLPWMRAEYARMITAHESSQTIQEVVSHMISSNGAIKILQAATLSISKQQNLDPAVIGRLNELLAASLENARAAVTECNVIAPQYEIDTKPLWDYKAKLEKIDALAAELGKPAEDLKDYHEDLSDKVYRIRNNAKRMNELNDLIIEAKSEYKKHAQILTQERIKASEGLSAKINLELPKLKLNRAQFSVKVEEMLNDPWTAKGFNKVTFIGRMNDGMPFSPIAETASGGELARMNLAIKVVLQTILAIPTLVFDEVDVGIGGAAAAALGERIAHLADSTQVITITHSPQVAARGEQHMYVSKKVVDGKTTSATRMLTMEERINEISRMLAGEVITGEASAAAKKLIDEAVISRQERLKNKGQNGEATTGANGGYTNGQNGAPAPSSEGVTAEVAASKAPEQGNQASV